MNIIEILLNIFLSGFLITSFYNLLLIKKCGKYHIFNCGNWLDKNKKITNYKNDESALNVILTLNTFLLGFVIIISIVFLKIYSIIPLILTIILYIKTQKIDIKRIEVRYAILFPHLFINFNNKALKKIYKAIILIIILSMFLLFIIDIK